MDKEEEKLLKKILPNRYESADAYNIRLNGSGVLRKVNEYINIESREDGQVFHGSCKADISALSCKTY